MSGKAFEACVKQLLTQKFNKVEEQYHTDWIGIFGQKIILDFYCSEEEKELGIEVKWQQVKGSTEQKLFYAVEQAKTHPIETIVLMGGLGWSKGAIAWATKQPNVYSLDRFFQQIIEGKNDR